MQHQLHVPQGELLLSRNKSENVKFSIETILTGPFLPTGISEHC